MITSFYIQESYQRLTGDFNEAFSKSYFNKNIYELINNCKSKTIYNNKYLYIINENDYFIDTIQVNNKNIICYKYITNKYYNKYKHIYDKLFELNLYNNIKYEKFHTQRLEIYIFNNLYGCSILNNLNIKITYSKEHIHNKININKLKFITRYQEKGTFIDYCIKYLINNKYNYAFDYLMSCLQSIDHTCLPDKLQYCETTKHLIYLLFEKNFIYEIKKFINYFKSLKTCDCFVNFDLYIYGEPDLISDDYVIDIKISKNNKIATKKNYLQVLFYTILTNKKKFCLYDPLNGDLYKYEINDNIINHIKKYIIDIIS